MCGIAFALGGETTRAFTFAERANRLLAHRGPDGQGIFQEKQVVLSHRRLAILDLSEAGAQPMQSEDKRYVIVHNGEIYNHIKLRNDFLPQVTFRGLSDTETLLMLYAHLGEKMLQHLVGMWAFAIWDSKQDTLFVCRDRYGQKPLYYRKSADGALLFSSEIKPLIEDHEHPAMNETAVVEYLALGNYGHLGHQTFFKEINSFRQGHYAKIKVGDVYFKEQEYWCLPKVKEKDKIPFDSQQRGQLKSIIQEAVSSQLLSDVKLGATLSGGLDSSIVVGAIAATALATTASATPVFTAQSINSRWDESQYVKAVEEKWGKNKIHLHWKELNQTSIADHLVHYITVQEEPFGDPSIMAHGFLMAMAKENGVKVVLGGQGADEVFFGYENMIASLLSSGIRKGHWRWVKENIQHKKITVSALMRLVAGAVSPILERFAREKSRHKKRVFITKKMKSKVDDKIVKLARTTHFYEVWQESVYGVHLPHLLHYDDRNCMSYSIEGRMPFLDHRIVEHVAKIKSDDFFVRGESKKMLRSACTELLPDQVLKRKDKIGFYTPLQDMLKRDILWIEKVLTNYKDIDKFIVHEVWKSDIAFFKSDQQSVEKSLRLWRVLSFVVWMEIFKIDTSEF